MTNRAKPKRGEWNKLEYKIEYKMVGIHLHINMDKELLQRYVSLKGQ